jgi:hypothetical protein
LEVLFAARLGEVVIEKRKQILEQRKVTPRPPQSQRANSALTTTTTQLSSTKTPANDTPIPATGCDCQPSPK